MRPRLPSPRLLSHAARMDAAPSQTVAPQPRSVCGASIFSCSDVPARNEIVHRRQLSTIAMDERAKTKSSSTGALEGKATARRNKVNDMHGFVVLPPLTVTFAGGRCSVVSSFVHWLPHGVTGSASATPLYRPWASWLPSRSLMCVTCRRQHPRTHPRQAYEYE